MSDWVESSAQTPELLVQKAFNDMFSAAVDRESGVELAGRQSPPEPKAIAADMAGPLAKALNLAVELCDLQYVSLEDIITNQWLKKFTGAYNRLYQAEETSESKEFRYSRQFLPLVE